MRNLLILGMLFSQISTDNLVNVTTSNFEILTPTVEQSELVAHNIELVKSWIYGRWRIEDVNFSKKCFVVCSPDKEDYKSRFNKEKPVYSLDAKSDNESVYAIWGWTDRNIHTSVIPEKLTYICIKEYELKNQVIVPSWAKHGMAVLNTDLNTIKTYNGLLSSSIAKRYYFSLDKLMSMQDDTLAKYKDDDVKLYEIQSAFLCLMLAKEFKSDKISKFFDKNLDGLSQLYKLKSNEDMELKFIRYSVDLSNDIVSGRTPNEYLMKIY